MLILLIFLSSSFIVRKRVYACTWQDAYVFFYFAWKIDFGISYMYARSFQLSQSLF